MVNQRYGWPAPVLILLTNLFKSRLSDPRCHEYISSLQNSCLHISSMLKVKKMAVTMYG
ncbi:MAG: hypothetical protein ISS14_04900 [Actinobacteria bacterium]|nr:hypothetical protein [Actinomycetota bacterium]